MANQGAAVGERSGPLYDGLHLASDSGCWMLTETAGARGCSGAAVVAALAVAGGLPCTVGGDVGSGTAGRE